MKNHNSFYSLFTIFACSVSLVSCTLSDEFDKLSSIESIEATGSFNANVLNETWLLKDLIPAQKLNLTEEADGNYSLGYENTSTNDIDPPKFPSLQLDPVEASLNLLNYSDAYNNTPVGEYFSAPIQIIAFDLPKPEIKDVTFSDDFKIENITLKDGAKITVALDIDSNSDTQVTVILPSIAKNEIPYSKTFDPIIGSSKTNLVIDDLDGYVLTPNPNVSGVIILPKIKKIAKPIKGSISTSVNVDIGDHHQSINGFFGEMKLPIDKIEFPFSMPEDFKGTENSQMTLKEVIITLKTNQNGFKFPIDLDLNEGNLCYYKGNDTPKPIEIIPVSKAIDEGTFTFKIKNINVLNLEKLVLNPIVTINKGINAGNNNITDTASITYNVTANLPLDIEAEDLAFEQVGDNLFFDDKTDVSPSKYEFEAGKIMLKGSVSSEIPMAASIQIYYKNNDDDETFSETLFDQPIDVSANGSSLFLTSITTEKLDALKKYKSQTMKITLNGSGAIMGNQKIKLKLGLAAKGTVKATF